jgi:hypothetical protein
MLQGDLSGANPIYDPATANAQKIKQVFPGNIIPTARIGAFAQKYNDFILTSPISPQDPAVRARGSNFIGQQRVTLDCGSRKVRSR